VEHRLVTDRQRDGRTDRHTTTADTRAGYRRAGKMTAKGRYATKNAPMRTDIQVMRIGLTETGTDNSD